MKPKILPEHTELTIIIRFIRYLKTILKPEVYEQIFEGYCRWSKGGLE